MVELEDVPGFGCLGNLTLAVTILHMFSLRISSCFVAVSLVLTPNPSRDFSSVVAVFLTSPSQVGLQECPAAPKVKSAGFYCSSVHLDIINTCGTWKQ